MTNVQVIPELLKPYDARIVRLYPASTRINHVANEEEECSRSVELADAQNRLFAKGRTSTLDDLARTKYATPAYFIFFFRRHAMVSGSRPLPELMSPRCFIARRV